MEGGGEANDGGGAITNGNEVTEADGSDAVTIKIRCSKCAKFTIQVSLESSVESFKSVLAKHCGIPPEEQRLIYKGRFLKDDQTLSSYGLKAEHTVDLFGGFVPAASNNTENTVDEGTIGGSAASSPFTLGSSGFLKTMDHEFLEIIDRLNNSLDALLNWAMNDPLLREVINRDPELALLVNHLASTCGDGGTNPDPLSRQFLRNQAISRMTQSLRSYINLLNHQLIETMQNPVFNLHLTSPQTIGQSLFSQLGQQQRTRDASQTGGGTARDPESIGLDAVTNRFSGLGTNDSNVGPEEVYASQVAQLQEMGFPDARQNLEALIATSGNVPEAIDRLRGNNRGQ